VKDIRCTGCRAGVLAPPCITRVGDGGTTKVPGIAAARCEGRENAKEAFGGGGGE